MNIRCTAFAGYVIDAALFLHSWTKNAMKYDYISFDGALGRSAWESI